MSATASTWYTALGRPAPTGYTYPSGYLSSSLTQSIAGNAGSGALAIDTLAQLSQKQIRVASTTIASGSNGLSLPQSTINVASTGGFDTSQSGTILVTTGAGVQTVTYTGTTGTSFTGCSGGTGSMTTGNAVTTTNGGFSATTNSQTENFAVLQLLSPPLTAQTIGASTAWTVQFAAQVSNAASGFTWGGICGLFLVNGSTGAIRTTLIPSNTAVGSAARTTTTELTCRLSSVSSIGFTSVAGDYFALELGVAMTTGGSNSAIPNITIFGDGSTSIGSDNAAASNAQSTFTTPSAVTYLPAVSRYQYPNTAIQPRSPGFTRSELPIPQVMQPKAPGFSRAELGTPAIMQARTGDANIYRMRGHDSVLNRNVFWVSSVIDSSGQQYGGPGSFVGGTLTDIVVASVLES